MDEVASSIAICSLSCRYPDAGSPETLWANLMAGRRSFRPIPPQRLAIAEYASRVIGQADSITPLLAGMLTDWRFDREAFLVPKAVFENTDLTHWLALQLASEAIVAAGGINRFDRTRTAVIVANTLTGEFSRSTLLRLRQPFLDDLLEEALAATGTEPEVASRIRGEFLSRLRARFAEPNEDSLAGALANTIAGRIANHFDLNGGAYTVDGACSSSLLAVANAAILLRSGAVDVVVTGAVDLSLDPFELVGFSRNGALSPTRMRVFDARSDGFWPGEGGAFSVLMRADDARRRGFPIQAVLRGWGMSTDGAGGLTRPDSDGQLLAYRRAYDMTGVDPGDLDYVEAHGTGTAVGDPAEITALAALREHAAEPLPIGSVKANIGHTKAAAGFAGLVKAVLSLKHGGTPPHAGCEKPHSIFRETGNRLFPAQQAKAYDSNRASLVGVSSFGFGGINLHVVLEGGERRPAPVAAFVAPEVRGEQGVELFLFREGDPSVLTERLLALRSIAPNLSLAELTDAASKAAGNLGQGDLRLAFVAGDADQLCERIDETLDRLPHGQGTLRADTNIHFGSGPRRKIGYLFSGQAAPVLAPSRVWLARFPFLKPLAEALPVCIEGGTIDTAIAQPAITYANLATMKVLEAFGVEAEVATGHSLGELAALAWSGSLDCIQTLHLAAKRGAVMAGHGLRGGGMLRLELAADDSRVLAEGLDCSTACVNGLYETVMSGREEAIAELSKRAGRAGIEHKLLRVSHAFHSPDMAPAAEPFHNAVRDVCFLQPGRSVISTVTGALFGDGVDIREQLCNQLIQPVLFVEALQTMAKQAALLFELGPGSGLARLASAHGLQAMAVHSQSDDLAPLLSVLAAAFAVGHSLDHAALFGNRGARTFDEARQITLLSNPCGKRAGTPLLPRVTQLAEKGSEGPDEPLLTRIVSPVEMLSSDMLLDNVRAVVADETGLPLSAIHADAAFQADLHLNSLAVTRIVIAACRRLGRQEVRNPTDFADATPAILASQLGELVLLSPEDEVKRVNGIRRWAAPYGMVWRARNLPKSEPRAIRWVGDPAEGDDVVDGEAGLLITLTGGLRLGGSDRLIALLQEAARRDIKSIAVLHNRVPISSFFRSLYQERAFETILLIDRDECDEDDTRVQELLTVAPPGLCDFRLGRKGSIETPVFERLSPPQVKVAAMPTAEDVILAVGCHRGIGAECAFALAANGARLVFTGRSETSNRHAKGVLELARSRGIDASYRQCDVTDRSAVAALDVDAATPSVLLFAAGVNEPMRLGALTPDILEATLRPKTEGLANVLDRFGGNLRQLVAFGSIIGRIGLEGECHYALANALQSLMVEDFAGLNPSCRCLSLEWTVWSGAGMGERLGTIERLEAKGVDALPFDEALAAFEEHMARGSSGTVAITGRFGPPEELDIGVAEKAPLRFIENVLVDFPGTELVVETELNFGRDPYLADHLVDGHVVLPGVIGLEAMAQVVATFVGLEYCHRVTDVAFHRAVVVGRGGLNIRIAVLRADDTKVDAEIFTEDDDFLSRCFSARFHLALPVTAVPQAEPLLDRFTDARVRPAGGLYGPLFFHGPRFRRVESLCNVTSRRVAAKLGRDGVVNWFGAFEPQDLVFADPAIADAALHVLQAAVPHRRVLPLSIGELKFVDAVAEARYVIGVENWTREHLYSFDVTIYAETGAPVSIWKDVRFKALGEIAIEPVLEAMPALCQPYLERMAREELGDDTLRLSLLRDGGIDEAQRRKLAIEFLGLNGETVRRADGRPILVSGEGFVGLSHAPDTTLAVHAASPVACDLAGLAAPYPNLGGRSMTAVDWARGEVLRKLGHSSPFTAMPVRGAGSSALTSLPVVLSRSLPVLGLAVAIGALCGAKPANTRAEMEVAE